MQRYQKVITYRIIFSRTSENYSEQLIKEDFILSFPLLFVYLQKEINKIL